MNYKRNNPMPVSSTDLLMTADFRGEKGWATMYGKAMLNGKLYQELYIVD